MTNASRTVVLCLASVCVFISGMLGFSRKVSADSVSLVSDLELEDLVRSIVSDIFSVAGEDSSGINIYVLQDPNINAFVYNNSVFVNTGLIVFAQDTNAIYGVLAHEVGHLVRHHIGRMAVRSSQDFQEAGAVALIGLLAVVGLGPIAAGAIAPAAMLIPMLSLSAIMQGKLQYSRDNETEADESAITYLNKMHKPVSGLYSTMLFFNKSMLPGAKMYKYLYTHPLPEERLERLRMAASREVGIVAPNCKIERALRRSQAKLMGYFSMRGFELHNNIGKFGVCFSVADLEFFKKYQKIHALWRDGKFVAALAEVSVLEAFNKIKLGVENGDIYLLETKSNILFASGKIEEAILFYRIVAEKALEVGEGSQKAAMANLAKMLISSPNEEQINEGIEILRELCQDDSQNINLYAQLAFAYAKLKNLPLARIYAAEANLRAGNCNDARRFANLAKVSIREKKSLLPEERAKLNDTASDIIDACEKTKKHGKKNS